MSSCGCIRCRYEASSAVALDDGMMHQKHYQEHQRGGTRLCPLSKLGYSTGLEQCSLPVNRGMSLEAIAALLGHRSMRMTMVYARIADRTVADEYFTVSEKVEALYDAPKT